VSARCRRDIAFAWASSPATQGTGWPMSRPHGRRQLLSTDQGNAVLDCRFAPSTAVTLAAALSTIPGLLGTAFLDEIDASMLVGEALLLTRIKAIDMRMERSRPHRVVKQTRLSLGS